MPARAWPSFLRPRPAVETPASFRLVFGALSGAALSFSYSGFYLSVYSWVCVGILMIVVFGARPKIAFACGFLHAIFFVFTSVPWIATVLSVHGGLSTAGGWAVLGLIAAAWGILTGTFAWIVNRLSQRNMVLACAGAPFLWVSFEFVRAHLPEISFPWNLLGYPASSNLALLQVTTLTGIYGLSFLVAAFNALVAWFDAAATPSIPRRLSILGAGTVLLLAVILAGPRLVPGSQANHTARAVQTNFPEAESYPTDWFQQHVADLDDLEQLSLAPHGHPDDLIVWPEAPAPFSMEDPQFARRASALAIHFGHAFLAGTIEWRPLAISDSSSQSGTRHVLAPYNSAILLDKQGQRVYTYDKIHLVPFGEYEPFPLIHRVVSSVSSEIGGFRKGSNYAVGHLPSGFTFSTFICYEAIYAGEIRRFAADGAQLLINISNDGWFGRSAAAEQHLRMARVRAVENRRWLLRVTNNGITASIDPYGRIYAPLPVDVRAAADLPYDFRTDETLYTRFGDWFAWLCVLISVILLASTFTKRPIAADEIPIPVAVTPVTATPAPSTVGFGIRKG
jgi:apolipoprotein N-acyltransferase